MFRWLKRRFFNSFRSQSKLKKAGKYTATGLLAIGLVGGYEGLRTTAYQDIKGVPTVCFGETRAVSMGDKYTEDDCRHMLGDALIEFEEKIRSCLNEPDRIPDKTFVAFLSLSYNIGTDAFCRSSIARKANEGDFSGACDAILLYNKSGGKVIKGLVNRRQDERNICLQGLHEEKS